MQYEFQLPSLGAIPEHVAGNKKWNCFQLFCAWQRPMVTAALESDDSNGEEVEFSDVTKELKRCWKSQPSEHVQAYKEIAKLLPLSLEDVIRMKKEHGKSVAEENRTQQGSRAVEGKGIVRLSGIPAVKVEKKPLKECTAREMEKKKKRKEEKKGKEEREEEEEKAEKKRAKEENKRLKEEKIERKREREERKRAKEESAMTSEPCDGSVRKAEQEDITSGHTDRLSCVGKLKEERKQQKEAERMRKAEAAALARQERERTRQQILQAKESSLKHEERAKRHEEIPRNAGEEAARALAEAERVRREDKEKRKMEWNMIRKWKEEEEERIKERERAARQEAERLAAERAEAERAKLAYEQLHKAAAAKEALQSAALRAQLEEERRQRKMAEERASALQRKFDLDLQRLTKMFQASCTVGGKKGDTASKLVGNKAVKRVLQFVNRFQATKRHHTRSHPPIFVVVDTNSLEKRVLTAWSRACSNSQYQRNVNDGYAPLVNGVIPIAVLRELDFFNKQGQKKARSLQVLLESQFRSFNEDKPCFLHPQGVEQVYQHNSSETRPINEDEHILSCCLYFREHYEECQVWLATKDRNLRLKAQSNGFKADKLESLLRCGSVPLHL